MKQTLQEKNKTMSKKMKIPSIFKNKEATTKQQYWQWPSCKHPKTLSFRAPDDVVFKTVNSVFLDAADPPPESLFTNTSSESAATSFSTTFSEEDPPLETIIRGVRLSERLFFEPRDTSSIVNEPLPFKESVAMALESNDPYMDFKKSMQEMVESQGLKDWDCLEELLGWYLKMNGKMNHRYIVGAFVDLLLGRLLSTSSSSTTNPMCCNYSDSTSYSSAESSFSSPSTSPALAVDDILQT